MTQRMLNTLRYHAAPTNPADTTVAAKKKYHRSGSQAPQIMQPTAMHRQIRSNFAVLGMCVIGNMETDSEMKRLPEDGTGISP